VESGDGKTTLALADFSIPVGEGAGIEIWGVADWGAPSLLPRYQVPIPEILNFFFCPLGLGFLNMPQFDCGRVDPFRTGSARTILE